METLSQLGHGFAVAFTPYNLLWCLVGTTLGTAIGVGFAWVAYEAVVKPALVEATMQIPWASLGAVVLIAALAGLLALTGATVLRRPTAQVAHPEAPVAEAGEPLAQPLPGARSAGES